MSRSASPVARCRRDGLDRGPPGPELHSSSKMVQYALLMLLLPLAVVASCPCPPAPDASAKVCGSNHRTYDSACHLECAKVPGLTVSHPGPCSALDMARRLLTANGTHPKRRPARSASEDFEECAKNNCAWPGNCGCRDDDVDCKFMCVYNCRCSSCLGMPGGDLDSGDKWGSCVKERGCERTWIACTDNCTTQDCGDACGLDSVKCECGCMEVARGNATTGSTSTTTEHPVTTGTEELVTSEAPVTVTEAPVTSTTEEPSAPPSPRPAALSVNRGDVAFNQPPAPPGSGVETLPGRGCQPLYAAPFYSVLPSYYPVLPLPLALFPAPLLLPSPPLYSPPPPVHAPPRACSCIPATPVLASLQPGAGPLSLRCSCG